MVPWLFALPKTGTKSAWLMGMALGLIFYRLSLAWILGLYGPIGTILILAFSILMGYSFRIARLLIQRFGLAAMLTSWGEARPSYILNQ